LEYPDNTREGIAAAFVVADFVEIDVRSTADGRLVLAHDAVLAGVRVGDATWHELEELDLGAGHRPVLLEGVLGMAGERRLDIEIKNSPIEPGFDQSLAGRVAALARPIDLITSFHWPTVDAARRARPDVGTGLLVDRVGSLGDAVDWAVAEGHEVIAPHVDLVFEHPGGIDDAHAAGLEVYCWTVNDPATARTLAGQGVDAIITDDPRTIGEAVKEES
jgi:glycerophosphoryl diester phosphodiesterase